MNIKPIQIALFLILILGALFGLTFLSEKGAIQKAQVEEDGFAFQNITLKYPTHKTFLELEKDCTRAKAKEDILKLTQMMIPVVEEPALKPVLTKQDTIVLEPVIGKDNKSRPDFSKIDTFQIQRIAYPANNPKFVQQLKAKLSSKSCRILHYGDSQIEGDRITGYLRNRLQGLYGGNGPGFLPLKPVYNQNVAKIKPSDNWLRYARFDPKKERFNHNGYGIYMSASRFTKYNEIAPDSIAIDSLPIIKASVTIGKSKTTYRRFRRFIDIGLHYGNCNFPIKISVYNNEALIQEGNLISDGQYHNYKIKMNATPDNLRIELEGKVSADFYGLTLDGGAKIQIDNIAMRGSSGTFFSSTSNAVYSQMANNLDPKIAIMQYGGNTVPYLKDSSSVRYFTKSIMRQASWLKRRTKDLNVLFIGPTDMSVAVNGNMETYPLLPYFNENLKKVCLENGIAYWDMYTAMGGEGSMSLWVDEKLAGNDYTHFTRKGTKVISELFFTSLYLDLK